MKLELKALRKFWKERYSDAVVKKYQNNQTASPKSDRPKLMNA